MSVISVIIPCYNQGHYLAEAVDTALGQEGVEVEVIVVNDGSTDHTRAVCERYGSRIVAIHQDNAGLPAARNAGILASRGEFLQFLDADDRILPQKLAEQVALLEANPPAGACWSDGWLINQQGERIGPANINHPSGQVLHSLLTMWGTQVAAVLVRRSALDAVARKGLWFDPDPSIRGCEDVDLWLRLAARYEFVTLDEKRFEYRVGHGSMSSNALMMLQSGLRVLERHCRHHGKCNECRRAVRAGRKRWRTVAGYGLMQQARRLVRERRWAEAAGRIGSVMRHCPEHLVRVLDPRHCGSKVRAICGRGVVQ